MPLSSESTTKNKTNGLKFDIKDENLFIVNKNKMHFMPIKIEDFEDYFETAYKSGALVKEYMVSIRLKKFDCLNLC